MAAAVAALDGTDAGNYQAQPCMALESGSTPDSSADSTWMLPSSGLTGSQCFYSCPTSLVGGNGTVWASNKTGYAYLRIDTASTPGYMTVA